MSTLAVRMAQEQPRIHQALQSAVDMLPRSVHPVAAYALEAGGKRLRPFLTVLVSRFFGYRADDIYPLSAAIELLHAATLLHDDVLDNASLRRGKPAVHRAFGVPQAILAGDAMVAQGCKIVAGYGDPRLVTSISEAIVRTAEGEILEIAQQGKMSTNLDTYYEIVTGKTAWMIRTACELGALRADAGSDLVAFAAEYGFNLGVAFQVVDDALDFAPSFETGKPEGGDVREGKFTPPMLLYVESLPASQREDFCRRFAALSLTEDEVRQVCKTVRERGFHKRPIEAADRFLDKARSALARLEAELPLTPERDNLNDILDFVRNRRA